MSTTKQAAQAVKAKTSKKNGVQGFNSIKPKPLRQNVGIDVAKLDLKVCFSQEFSSRQIKVIGSRTFPNTKAGFAALLVC